MDAPYSKTEWNRKALLQLHRLNPARITVACVNQDWLQGLCSTQSDGEIRGAMGGTEAFGGWEERDEFVPTKLFTLAWWHFDVINISNAFFF
jgi:hypothetical protein